MCIRDRLKSKVISAMVYPSIVLFIAVGIVIFLMLVIVPKFKAMFAEQNQEPVSYTHLLGLQFNACTSPFNLPAPGRRQLVYVIFRFSTCLLYTSRCV